MEHTSIDAKPMVANSGSIVVLFRPSAHRLWVSEPLCDQFGSVVDLKINGQTFYMNEAPMVVQPDYLVDNSTDRIVGLGFELPSPSWMLSRCNEMLRGIDTNAIRVSTNDLEDVWMDVIWSDTDSYKRSLAQLDFGLWGFLYSVKEPSFLQDGDFWTTPEGLVIGDLGQLGLPVSIPASEAGDTTIELMRVTEY